MNSTTCGEYNDGIPCVAGTSPEDGTALPQLTPFRMPQQPSSFATQHTPEQRADEALAQRCAAAADTQGGSGGGRRGSDSAQSADAIASLVEQCTAQLRTTPMHLRYSQTSVWDGPRSLRPVAVIESSPLQRVNRMAKTCPVHRGVFYVLRLSWEDLTAWQFFKSVS